MTLDECRENVGRAVVYDAGHPGARKEDGVIVDVGPVYCFVLFRGDTGAKATPPERLELLCR